MNEITIKEREWKITEIKEVNDDEDDEEDKFEKGKSIFKNFKEDNEEILRKMFELDMGYSKITRVIKNNDEEFHIVKDILWKNYARIKGIYLSSTTSSEYPILSWNDFTILCNKCKIVDKYCNLSTIDRVYIATNVNLHNNSN
jgi:hypothetical protein